MASAIRRRRWALGATSTTARRPFRPTLESLDDRCVPAVITEFPLSTATPVPQGITDGPDGNVWFTDPTGNKIGRLTPTGVVTEFTLPTAGSDPRGITTGPDGALWFVEFGTDSIGRLDPATGAVTEFPLTIGSGPQEIVTGPDGNLWFTESITDMIGQITPDGTITEFAVPGAGSTPFGITVGPDDRLWFTQFGSSEIGAITADGTIEEFSSGFAGEPTGITTGADGNLWYGSNQPNRLGRITPAGMASGFTGFGNLVTSIVDIVSGPDGNLWATGGAGDRIIQFTTAAIPVPTEFDTSPGGMATGIAAGPDGNLYFTQPGISSIGQITTAGVVTDFNLRASAGPGELVADTAGNVWFTQPAADKVGRLSPTGALVEFSLPNTLSEPQGVTVGPDGNLWFTEFGGDRIGRITPAGVLTEFPLTVGAGPRDIVTGPDGNLWFTEAAADMIGMITPAGVVTEFVVPGVGSIPFGITAGADGNLWFAQFGSDEIGMITTAGVVTEFTLPAGRQPFDVASGANGAIFFTESGADRVGRLDPFAGTPADIQASIVEFVVPGVGSQPLGIVAGPDDALWFTQAGSDEIGRLTTFGLLTELSDGITAGAGLAGIATLPGGGLVFAESTAAQIGTVALSADLSVTKDDGATTAVPGLTVTYTITVTNAAGGDTTPAQVTDTFPAVLTGVTWTAAFAGGASGNAAGNGNINETVTLPAGGSITYTVTATIDPTATGDLVNTATVSGSFPDADPTNNSATDTNALTPQVDIAVTKDDGVASAVPGTTVTYTITVTNTGPSTATGVGLADTFPAAITAADFTSTAAGGATGNTSGTGNISDTLTLPSGGSVTYTITATIDPAATGDLVNTVTSTVPAGTTDTNPANDSATDTNTLTPTVDVAVTKDNGTTTSVPGGLTTYTIVVTNTGPSTAAGVTLVDVFPGIIFTSAFSSTAAGGATGNTNGIGNIGDTLTLPSGSSVTYTVNATIDAPATGDLVNTVSAGVPAGTTDTNPANNSATDTDTLTPTTDLIVSIFGMVGGTVGSELTYTVVVTNNGPSAATGVTLQNVFPTRVTLGSVTTTQGTVGSDNSVDIGTISFGASVTVTITLTPTQAGTRNVSATVSGNETDPSTANNTVTQPLTFAPFPPIFVFGSGPGGPPIVRVVDATSGAELLNFLAFPAEFLGGVSVAQGDLTGDGVPEIIVGAGAGGSPLVGVFDLRTGDLVRFFFAYAPDFRGGAQVAVADITGDGIADVLAGAGVGGSPHVAAFDGPTAAVIRSYFAFDDSFRDGVTVAGGDVNGDGIADIVAGTKQGGAPQIAAFDGPTRALLLSFFTADPSFRGGISVGAADLNGDGLADIFAGAGIGGGPVVAVFDPTTQRPIASIFAFDEGFRGGVNIATVDTNGDGITELLAAPGPGLPPQARLFGGLNLAQLATIDPFPGASTFLGGIEVG